MASIKNVVMKSADGSVLSAEQVQALLANLGVTMEIPVVAPKVSFTDDVKNARIAAHEEALAAYNVVATQLQELHATVRKTTSDLVEAGCQNGYRYPELGELVDEADIMTATSRAPRDPVEGVITPRGVNPYRLAVYFADLEPNLEMKNADIATASGVDGVSPLIAKAIAGGQLAKVGTGSRSGRFKINATLTAEEWYAVFYGGNRISFDAARIASEAFLSEQAGPAPESAPVIEEGTSAEA